MSLLPIAIAVAIVLSIAYLTYGRLLSRLLQLDNRRETPAIALRDDVDYEPIEAKFLMGQHFSAIAAAGPIVGPVLAGLAFGWLPALAWIVVGSIFIGGVHDMTALVASVRHRALSIAEVVRQYMSQLSYLLFLAFVWIALVYIIVAFTDITAASFVGAQKLENGETVSGPGIATSSLLYLLIPVAMGLLLRFTRLSLGGATVIFLPLVGLAIWVGQQAPFELAQWLNVSNDQAHKFWDVAILLYCVVAGVAPVWLLLQPRGHLGGYFLYAALAAAAIGLVFGNHTVQYPRFQGWTSARGEPLFPMLFITIACGACSGFHSLIASGTTSKQLRRETDARSIGYGAMLLEAMVATISLACVMMLDPRRDAVIIESGKPNLIYAHGLGAFLQVTGIPVALCMSFALMAFTTFVYDTLDVCTRLGRFIIQELTGWRGARGRWFATALTAGVPIFFVTRRATDASGKPIEVWRIFWELFGASNQLLAALGLLGVTVWLWRSRRAWWVWLVTGLPMVWMYTMSTWALFRLTTARFLAEKGFVDPVAWAGVCLMALAAVMLLEAVRIVLFPGRTGPAEPKPSLAHA
jgi:carbon starvation protein